MIKVGNSTIVCDECGSNDLRVREETKTIKLKEVIRASEYVNNVDMIELLANTEPPKKIVVVVCNECGEVFKGE